MGVKRYDLSEAQWHRIAPVLPGKAADPGRTGADNRLFVNGLLWALRSGAFWQHLPERTSSRSLMLVTMTANSCVRSKLSEWRRISVARGCAMSPCASIPTIKILMTQTWLEIKFLPQPEYRSGSREELL